MNKPCVIILIGGKSSRFSKTKLIKKNFVPKSLSKINNKSVLLNIIEHFVKNGFTKFILPLGYYKNLFVKRLTAETKTKFKINLFKNKINFKDNELEIFFVKTKKTANKAQRVLSCLKKIKLQNFVVSYGDALGNVNLNKMYIKFKKTRKECLAAGYKVYSQYGHYNSNIKNKSFIEKPLINEPINIGYFFFKKSNINLFIRSHKKDLENGIIKSLYRKNKLELHLHNGSGSR